MPSPTGTVCSRTIRTGAGRRPWRGRPARNHRRRTIAVSLTQSAGAEQPGVLRVAQQHPSSFPQLLFNIGEYCALTACFHCQGLIVVKPGKRKSLSLRVTIRSSWCRAVAASRLSIAVAGRARVGRRRGQVRWFGSGPQARAPARAGRCWRKREVSVWVRKRIRILRFRRACDWTRRGADKVQFPPRFLIQGRYNVARFSSNGPAKKASGAPLRPSMRTTRVVSNGVFSPFPRLDSHPP